MRKLLFISIALVGLASSCNKEKDWKCTTYVNGVEAGTNIFTGTKEQMEAYESYHVVLGNVYETKCK